MLVRFEYVTDDAVYLDGLLIDGIAIPELDFTDTDGAGSGWQVEGFSRAGVKLAQGFIVQLVTSSPGGEYTVSQIPLDGRNSGWMKLTIPGDDVETVVIVSPTTPGTRHEARYVLGFRESGP